jgi:nucleoside-diphosphate-sugar epimerase
MRRFAIHDFVERLERNPHRLVLWGDGGQTRDYLYVEDLVRAFHLIAVSGAPGEVYNVASGHSRTIRQVAEGVLHAMGLRDCEVTVDGRNSDAEAYRMEMDISKLQQIGFRPTAIFEEALATTVAWLRSNRPQETV